MIKLRIMTEITYFIFLYLASFHPDFGPWDIKINKGNKNGANTKL